MQLFSEGPLLSVAHFQSEVKWAWESYLLYLLLQEKYLFNLYLPQLITEEVILFLYNPGEHFKEYPNSKEQFIQNSESNKSQ